MDKLTVALLYAVSVHARCYVASGVASMYCTGSLLSASKTSTVFSANIRLSAQSLTSSPTHGHVYKAGTAAKQTTKLDRMQQLFPVFSKLLGTFLDPKFGPILLPFGICGKETFQLQFFRSRSATSVVTHSHDVKYFLSLFTGSASHWRCRN